MPTQVKICGVRRVEDALGCFEAGADAIGLNFWPGTPRCVDQETAAQIIQALEGKLEIVGVFVDAPLIEIERIRKELGIEWIQLHGNEPPEFVQELLPHAYKALGVGESSVLEEARCYSGEHLLLDAKGGPMPGGSGHTFNWELAKELAQERKLTLAGGLTPDNVAQAIEEVQPYRVDVSSGVESTPGIKDLDKVQAFVKAAKGD